MYEERFLEQALEEIESLLDENKELKRLLSVYEKFASDVKNILNRGKDEEGTIS